ncbi:uncharacterized protein BKA55DRAFT_581200 [Fusarium redolens]|uniref:Uncharacterized protein n=1 Tax=Fusarium redolens TaxID=48865 RepID=A0A9P9G1W7_FUSRE|nr:uncharacterized protein BKA55DRAFT_581200 [Fusarium redolens]KAH7231634.1 hypothetical protein BKA55DRAFT_581200 [Fusarium redolens]
MRGQLSNALPAPSPLLRHAMEKYQQSIASDRNRDISQDWQATNTQRPFQPELVRAKIVRVMESVPFNEDQGVYTARNPLIYRVRSLIRTQAVGCSLCAFYEWGPIVETHKLKRCSHRDALVLTDEKDTRTKTRQQHMGRRFLVLAYS